MGKELPLCWPGRRGAPSERSSRFPLLSPAPVAPYMGSPFPLNTRPYSNPRGLRLPAASLCTEAPIPTLPAGSPGAVLQSWPLLGDGATTPSTSTLSPPPRQRAGALPCTPTAQGPGHGREICFHGVKPFYFINYSTKTDGFAGALQGCFLSSCLSVGFGAADLLFFASVTISKTFLEVFNIIR